MNPALKNSFEIAVIGGGPAGITAAAQATRIGADAALFEREKLGGLIRCANLIENFPGFYGKDGAEAAEKLAEHARLVGVKVVGEKVKNVRPAPAGGFELETESGIWHAKAVIVATGTHPHKIRIPGLKPKDVRYGIECTEKFSGRYVAIIGGGDAALDQALRLSKFAELVIVIARSGIKGLPLLVKRCAAAGVEFREDEIVSGERIKGAYTLYMKHGKYLADALFAFIGREPNIDALSMEIRHTLPQGDGEISIRSGVPGLYFAGDIIAGNRRYLSVAVGTGMLAAIEAIGYVKGLERRP